MRTHLQQRICDVQRSDILGVTVYRCARKTFPQNNDWIMSLCMSINSNSMPFVCRASDTARLSPTVYDLNHTNINCTHSRVITKSSCARPTKIDSALWAGTREIDKKHLVGSRQPAAQAPKPTLPSPAFSPFCMLTSSHVGRSVHLHFRSRCGEQKGSADAALLRAARKPESGRVMASWES